MKISMTSQPKSHPWMIFTMFLTTSVMLGEGATSFSPPSVSLSPTYAPVINVIGKVYCYRCFNEAHPEESHAKMHLEGAMVKVTCQANDQALVGFGYTKNSGKYSIILKGLPISNNFGADSCKVELHAAPGGSECNVPIELNLSGLSIYSKSNEGVVLKANQILAFASKKSSGCSKPHKVPPMHLYNPPPVPYHYASPPFNYKSPPLSYQYSPPPSNQFPHPPLFPSAPQIYYPSPPPYHQSTPPKSYQSPPEYNNYPLAPQGLKTPAPTHKFLPPPYYHNIPPPQHHYSPSPNNYVSPPLAYQYPQPPYKSPVLPSSPVTPHHYISPPPYQYSPPPYYPSLPPPAQHSPPLPPIVPKHLHPKVPQEKSPQAPLQPLYQYNSPPPANEDTSSTTPPLHSYKLPPPNQLS